MMCSKGYKECYSEYDIAEAVIDTMCRNCSRFEECNACPEDEDSTCMPSCDRYEQIVKCLYLKFPPVQEETP